MEPGCLKELDAFRIEPQRHMQQEVKGPDWALLKPHERHQGIREVDHQFTVGCVLQAIRGHAVQAQPKDTRNRLHLVL